jgi:hypothetical protein
LTTTNPSEIERVMNSIVTWCLKAKRPLPGNGLVKHFWKPK